MYFLEQLSLQYKALMFAYINEGPWTPGWTPEAAVERATTKEMAVKPDAKILAEKASDLSLRFNNKFRKKDEMLAQISGAKPEELSMGKEIDPNAKPEKPEEFPVWKEVTPNLSESIDQKMYDWLLEKYGKERLDAMSKIYEELKWTEWFKAPQTIEEFEALMKNRLADGQQAWLIWDADVPWEESVVEWAASEMLGWASSWQLWAYAAPSWAPNYPSSSLKLSPWEAVANDAQLQKAIAEAETSNPKAAALLKTAGSFLWPKGKEWSKELAAFLELDPCKTAWCKAFVNKCCKANWIPLNSSGSLFSLDSMNDGRPLKQNESPLPWDLVMVRRNGGWHIWFCLWMSANGNPIILWWNQWEPWEVSIKEEKRELVWINRVCWEPTETPQWNPNELTS